MEITMRIKGSENKKVFHGAFIRIHGFYQGVTYAGAWCKDDITFIDVLFFSITGGQNDKQRSY